MNKLMNNRYDKKQIEGTFVFESILANKEGKQLGYMGVMIVNNDQDDLIKLTIFSNKINDIATYNYIQITPEYDVKYKTYKTTSKNIKQIKEKQLKPIDSIKTELHPEEIKLDMLNCNLNIKSNKTIVNDNLVLNGHSTMNVFFNKVKNEFKPEIDKREVDVKTNEYINCINEKVVKSLEKEMNEIYKSFKDNISDVLNKYPKGEVNTLELANVIATEQLKIKALQNEDNVLEIGFVAYKISRQEKAKSYSSFVTTVCFDQYLALVEFNKQRIELKPEDTLTALEETIVTIDEKFNEKESLINNITQTSVTEENVKQLEELINQIDSLFKFKHNLIKLLNIKKEELQCQNTSEIYIEQQLDGSPVDYQSDQPIKIALTKKVLVQKK